MEIVVTSEYRFSRTPDGAVWTDTLFHSEFWSRYLEGFDRVVVVARCAEIPSPPTRARRVDAERISVVPLAHYIGPLQYLRTLPRNRAILRDLRVRRLTAAFLFRAPSQIGEELLRVVRPGTFALEVIGDPYDVFAPGAVKHPLRPYFRWKFAADLRRACRQATAVSYVTDGALQRRYPPSRDSITASYSSIELVAEAIQSSPRTYAASLTAPRIVGVGTLDQMYKGFDTLIDAVSRCPALGLRPDLTIVGGGKHGSDLRAIAERLGLSVRFVGHQPGPESVRAYLDAADVFVMPSRQEGLPRALIEAMARGLPAVGTRVGGIPELLDEAHLVPPNDPEALASSLVRMCASPTELTEQSRINLESSKRYRADELRARRAAFYRAYRSAAEADL